MNDFWQEMAKIECHINFGIKMDDLSNASTLSNTFALYDFFKGSAQHDLSHKLADRRRVDTMTDSNLVR